MGPRQRQEGITRLDWERQHIPLGGEIIEPAGEVVRMRTPDGSHHFVSWSQLDPHTADAVIDREIAWHKSLGVSFEWKVYSHDRPADLKDRLATRGFHIGQLESVMILDAADAHAIQPPVGSGSIQVDQVQSAKHLTDFKQIAEHTFGGDWSFTTGQLAAALQNNDPAHRGYIASLDGQPAAIGRLYVHPQSHFAGLYGGATLPEFRGKGLYKANVQARIRDALAWGAKYMMVDARETSRPILEKMGFVSVGQTWPCVMELR